MPEQLRPHGYYEFNRFLRDTFGSRVHKISLDAGFTCPNRDGTLSATGCIYCNPKGSGTGAHQKGISIRDQLEQSKKYIIKRYKAKKFIAYFQSYTNTYAPFHILKSVYDEALGVRDVVGISIGTRPDCVDDKILNRLESCTKNHMVWIEYGLQSAKNATLSRINRGHDLGCFLDAVQRTKNRGIKICAHMILGLPGENRKDMLHTAETISRLNIDGIKIHLLYVVKDTPLAQQYLNGEYQCLGQSAYVNLVCDILEILPANIVIQRLTGDPHKHELVAPKWSLNKNDTIDRIRRTLKERCAWQGMSLS